MEVKITKQFCHKTIFEKSVAFHYILFLKEILKEVKRRKSCSIKIYCFRSIDCLGLLKYSQEQHRISEFMLNQELDSNIY